MIFLELIEDVLLYLQSSQFSKLEKADILELTVKHLRALQRQQAAGAMTSDPSVVSKYRAGFNECAKEVIRYMSSVRDVSDEIKDRVVGHLAGCLQVVNHMTPPHSEAMAAPHPHCLKPLHVHIPQQQPLTAAMPAPALLVPQGVLPAALSLTPSSISSASSSPPLSSSPGTQTLSPVTAVSLPAAIQTAATMVPSSTATTSHTGLPGHISGAFKIVPSSSCPAGAVALYLGGPSAGGRTGDLGVDAVPVYSLPLPQVDGAVTAFVPPVTSTQAIPAHHVTSHQLTHVTNTLSSSVKQEYLSCAVDLRQHSKVMKPISMDVDRSPLPVSLGHCTQASLSDEKLWRPW